MQKTSKKVKALYLSVAFFFAFFSFQKHVLASPQITTDGVYLYASGFSNLNTATTGHHLWIFKGSLGDYSGGAVVGFSYGAIGSVSSIYTAQGCTNFTTDSFRCNMMSSTPWFGGSGLTAGYYWIEMLDYTSGSATSTTFFWDGTIGGDNTRINTVTPYNNQLVATSTHTTVGATGYLNQGDLNTNTKLIIHLQNSNASFQNCIDVICHEIAQNSIILDFEYDLLTSGGFSYSSSTQTLPIGKYWVTTSVQKGSSCIFGYCLFTSTITSTSTSFVISTTTKADHLKDDVSNQVDKLTGGGASFADCTVTSFSFLDCMSDLILYAFVPTPSEISGFTNSVHDSILTHFPLGYVTDFVSIISTTTEGSLPGIHATIPAGIAGTGASINLTLDHALDQFLNANMGSFYLATNTSAFATTLLGTSISSTTTLYEYTEHYWEIFVSVMAFLYILGRILGQGIPTFGSRGALSDTSSGDDSYRLKEELYRIRNRK